MHIIQKQTIDINVGDRSEADFWQDRMSIVCIDFFNEKLDDILSSHFVEFDKTIIDSLIIDLGTISKFKSPETLALQYETALIHAISEYKKKHPFHSKNVDEAGIQNPKLSAIIHYLKLGYLKWNVNRKEDIRKAVNSMIIEFPEQLFQTLMRESNLKNSMKRLAQLIDSDTWKEITMMLFKSKNWTYKFLLEKIQLLIAHPSIKFSKKINATSLQDNLKLSLVQAYGNQVTRKTTNSTWLSSLAYIWQSIIPLIQLSQTEHNLEEVTNAFTSVFNFSTKDKTLWKTELVDSQFLPDPKTISHKDDERKPSLPKDSSLYCRNTGAVILWPFLSGFFSSCGWTDQEGQFYEHSLDKAIISIYHLCTGTFPEDETELPIMKIMCGVPLEDSIDLSSLPSKNEQNKLGELLQNVTRNWSILKTDKVEAIRKPFLQRYGAVKLTEHGWLVIPEKNGIDILLQRLPWPISTIKLPWIDYLIQVDWS